MRKTKIIATWGPALSDPKVLSKVLKKVDILRINFSHNNERSWAEIKQPILRAIKASKRDIKIFADMPGPKVRLGVLEKGIPVNEGEQVCFEFEPRPKSGSIPVEYDNLYKDAKKGTLIIIGDGEPRFVVDEIVRKQIQCTALTTGVVNSRKGIWLAGAHITLPNPTEVDLRLAKFAKKEGFDYISLSFVVSRNQIETLRNHVGDISVIAKIEKVEAVDNIDSLAKGSEIIMVARGDLGLDFLIEQVPEAQRKIIDGAKRQNKPFIVATQVLTSMINSPIPTRAEINDIATSVRAGAYGIMLSDETTVGKYPVEAIEILSKTIEETEKSKDKSLE